METPRLDGGDLAHQRRRAWYHQPDNQIMAKGLTLNRWIEQGVAIHIGNIGITA